MAKSTPYTEITFAPGQRNNPIIKRMQEHGLHPTEITESPQNSDYRAGKRHLHIGDKRGTLFHDCASMSDHYLCCNVKVMSTVSNCPYECSYCFLQNYLTDTTLEIISDTDALLAEIQDRSKEQPWRFWRLGTWELGDSLAVESETGASADLVEAVATLPNVVLELKTKSANIDSLLNLQHNGHTVVAWTLNPQEVVKREEYRTASIGERIDAMQKVANAGYLLALHFDPMIYYPGWETGYRELIMEIAAKIPAKRIAWISMGSLRFNPEMQRSMEQNYPGSHSTRTEMVLGDDGKVRYVKPIRLQMYRHLYQQLQQQFTTLPFIYLCMERRDIWDRVLGWSPDSTAHLDYLMTEHLWTNFPTLVPQRPNLSDYAAA